MSEHGIFDGFEAYLTPTDDDYREVLQAGLIVLDANVLLNLYRYSPKAREALFAVLEGLGDQLWVPHQAVAEFWRNRESTLRDPHGAESAEQDLERHFAAARRTLRAWSNRVEIGEERRDEVLGGLDRALESAQAFVSDLQDEEASRAAANVHNDEVVGRLRDLLDGRVGLPLDSDALKEARKEAQRRIDEEQPPGYKDASKSGDREYGDYMVWEQTLREAESRQVDGCIVTADLKEDWWRKEQGFARGPRPELVSEYMGRAGGSRLFMMSPSQLMDTAARLLDIEVSEAAVDQAESVEDESEAAQSTSGWTVDAIAELLDALEREAEVQYRVLLEAALTDGDVPRDRVYQIGGYEESRTLRGFTRPIRRISKRLIGQGSLDNSAIDILKPQYPPEWNGTAASFRVPESVLELLRVAASEE